MPVLHDASETAAFGVDAGETLERRMTIARLVRRRSATAYALRRSIIQPVYQIVTILLLIV